MHKKPTTILAINPGTKRVAIAIFNESELREWFTKIFKGKWSKVKMKTILTVITDLATRYGADVLAMKQLHRARSSRNLDSLTSGIKLELKRRGLDVYEYSIKDVERLFLTSRKTNKKNMAEQVGPVIPGPLL